MMELDAPWLVFGGPYSNSHATRALLAEAARRGIPSARILCTGDVVAYAADAAATTALVMGSGIHVLMGNCEEQLAAGAGDCGCGFEEGTACDLLARGWYAHALREVTPAQRDWMGALPRRLVLRLPDGRRLAVVHGGATEINRFLFRSTPENVLAAEIAATGCDGVVAGHSGIPFARRVGQGVWINAGAIGMPAHDGTPRVWFSLLRPRAEGLEVSFHALDYDHAAAAAAMRRARLAEGYATALETGLWPSEDVLPQADRARRGVALEPPAFAWAVRPPSGPGACAA
ncbi:metallophosphoesterase family protein [Roseococcus suduntuyensis]|uniref:Putative phosphodiesterase n=1 Tax=Roseococcus suduntuyensis TaxID=455361 RepID=A0A840ABW9_9PROT|nr:metallophosphoesterase family protein [Roseococcus suduntuyensis]MBB3897754.1 putative phosphodiesterase [Roseococcus suduntuyensis]